MAKLRKMLGAANSPYILSLVGLIETQSKQTLATWCLNYTEEHILPLYEATCLDDNRPRDAILVARSWLSGNIKFPIAKKAILACHEAAREQEENPVAQAAARAVGHAASVIHVATHSLGLCFYGAVHLPMIEWGSMKVLKLMIKLLRKSAPRWKQH